MKNKPTISLIIPAYNEEEYIGTCLEYVLKNAPEAFYEIIVVDNGSTDRTKEVAMSYPGVKVVSEVTKGLTRARQKGFEEAKGDILAYIDADTRMPPKWYTVLLSQFCSNPAVGCVSGPYLFYDATFFQKIFVKVYWYLLGFPTYILLGYMATGGNFAIKKEVLDKMNGFDTTIEFYGEDTNVARRAYQYGKVIFTSQLFMYTSARRLNKQGWIKTAIIYIQNFISEVLRHRPATQEYNDHR